MTYERAGHLFYTGRQCRHDDIRFDYARACHGEDKVRTRQLRHAHDDFVDDRKDDSL